MTGKEKAKTIVRIVISVIILAVLGSFMRSCTFIPSMFFWFIAEIFLFADGCAIYNLLCYTRK